MEKVQKTRRTHTKSRGGCFECKRRKLKCDESKPICAGCQKRETECQYPTLTTSHHSPFSDPGQGIPPPNQLHPAVSYSPMQDTISNSQEEARISHSQSPAITEKGNVSHSKGVGQFDMDDMMLWHHFIHHTAKTMVDPWENALPKVALTCAYLMHGILALSALHLVWLAKEDSERDKFNYLASQHQALALPVFQRAMADATPETACDLFAYATLLMVFNFASNREPEYLFPFAKGTSYKELSNWMLCIRGCSSIFLLAEKNVESGPLGFLFPRARNYETALERGALPSPEEDESLSRIKNTLLNLPEIKSKTTAEEMEAYHDAIHQLRNLLAATAMEGGLDSVGRRSVSSIWANSISVTYIEMLDENRPPALVIMAHYCLLVAKCGDIWYMTNRGLDLFKVVRKNLGEEWAPYISLPLKVFYN